MEYINITELEAVNILLRGIGETPIESLEAYALTAYPEAGIAQQKLHETSRMVQSMGLDCNTEEYYQLTPDEVSGEIELPTNVLFVEPSDSSSVVMRGGKLYDKANQTYVFTSNVTVDLCVFLPIEDLPHHVSYYIIMLAQKEFQTEMLGSPEIDEQFRERLGLATVGFYRGETKASYRALREISRTVQSQGFDCNTEEDYPLTPDTVTKEITIPTNFLFCEPTDGRYKYTVRGGKLYDKTNHTYEFDKVVKANVRLFLALSDLPQYLRDYIILLARKRFLVDILGTDAQDFQLDEDIQKAKINLHRSELNSDTRTMLDNPATYEIVRRYW